MTTGLLSQNPGCSRYREILLLESSAAAAIPTESTAGSVTPLSLTPSASQFFDLRTIHPVAGSLIDDWEVFVHNTAGTASVTCSIKLWAYSITTGLAYPWGVGTDALKGVINDYAAMGPVDTDKLRHWERIPGPGFADGIMAQVVSSTGTGTETFSVYVRFPVNPR